MLWPVYEFRPLPTSFEIRYRRGDVVRRYADGKWIEDDGEYDVAFISNVFCLYVNLPHHRNIVCSWLTTHWSANVPEHRADRGNPWHYALREGETTWGDYWRREAHPNTRAGDAGMTQVCSERGAANGLGVEFKPTDPIIKAGLLRERDSKKPFEWPHNMTCMRCGAIPPIEFKAEAA